MNRTIRAIVGVIFILVITFSAISICQDLGKSWKLDVTDRRLYTLSDGTKAILAKLNQPIKVKLYYAEKATLKASDQIRYFNNYYHFVKALLDEYVDVAKGMIDLEVIDPRPFSEEEAQALRYGLRRFPITEEESFFFGLVVQTQFGVEKVIPFFSPDRQNFVEYDISYLIDSAITRQKKRVGILSSLPVMGEDTSGYMAQLMRMQGQQPKGPWTIVEQLKQKYEVKRIATDVNEINDVDVLLVIHPKNLKKQTLFAIDQFVLGGGRTIICVDPHCVVDRPGGMMQMQRDQSQSSDLNVLTKTWGLEMPADTFAGDRALALKVSKNRDQRAEKLIGFLDLTAPQCFNPDSVITSNLNDVRVLFSGVLREVDISDKQQNATKIERTPLLRTTNRGNSWSPELPVDLMIMNPTRLMNLFTDGTKPVNMAYLVTGRFKSSFPDGIDIEAKSSDTKPSDKTADANEGFAETTKHITGLKKAASDCAVAVFADVDFISDIVAYQDSIFGKIVIADNATLLLNTIDHLCGSSDLISIRSRGNFRRPFEVVDKIEKQAEAETVEEEARINAEIEGFRKQLESILASAKDGEQNIIGSSILQKKKELQLKIREAERKLRQVKMKRRERIEHLGNMLRNFNMLTAPAVILVIAIALGIRRAVRKRYYISHASDS